MPNGLMGGKQVRVNRDKLRWSDRDYKRRVLR
ncbi:MAG: 30S ribosomal protein S12, partial [Candidatus Thermoplasmatota archaeon]|nr:30S ribosomal protein S12 [Candidatus Thermoplasmatota archaeon]